MENTIADDPSQDPISTGTRKFGEITARTLGMMFGSKCSAGSTEILTDGLAADRKFFVSILFTGTVYGEYILAMSENVAAAIVGVPMPIVQSEQDAFHEEIAGAFCELLNTVVGESINCLGKAYKKLTITAPKVQFGKVSYPKIRTGKTLLTSDKGPIECYLYIDRMKLDIASSYKETLTSLLKAHNELKAAVRKLQAQQSLLVQSEKMAAIGTMTAGVAHEINTPLGTVAMIGSQLREMLSEPQADTKYMLEMLEVIEKTIARIAKITGSMRTFANGIQNGSVSLSSMKDIVESTLIFCDQALQDRGVKLLQDPLPEKLKIECHLPQISQLLLNLIHNACDAAEEVPDRWVRIGVSDLGGTAEIRITDSGSGVPEKIRDRIFDPFFTTKSVGKGMGLGLSASKGIVDNHGGTIVIDAKSPHTCFVVCLPKTFKKAA